MAISIIGNGTITGINTGGLPDGCVANDDLAGSIADGKITGLSSSKLSGALPAIDGSALTGISGGDVYFGSISWTLGTTGNLAVTGVGFQPSALVVFAANDGTNKSWSIGGQFNSGSEGMMYAQSYHATDRTAISTSESYYLYDGTTSTDVHGAVVSLDADGFTIGRSESGSPSGTVYLRYIAIKTG